MLNEAILAYIGIGANLGDRLSQAIESVAAIAQLPHVSLLKQSSWYRTRPWGQLEQPDFINGVIVIKTTLSAISLLYNLQAVEQKQGRVRTHTTHWGPRLMDLDLLLYGDDRIQQDDLVVPHPYLKERAFVLHPLAEIAPDLVLPSGESILSLARMKGMHHVKPWSEEE